MKIHCYRCVSTLQASVDFLLAGILSIEIDSYCYLDYLGTKEIYGSKTCHPFNIIFNLTQNGRMHRIITWQQATWTSYYKEFLCAQIKVMALDLGLSWLCTGSLRSERKILVCWLYWIHCNLSHFPGVMRANVYINNVSTFYLWRTFRKFDSRVWWRWTNFSHETMSKCSSA